jgi:NADH pyrophosphatase NudC (nudix superfamily)
LTAKEQAEDAIKRELLEETGIAIENVEMFRVRTIARHIEILFRATASSEGSVQSREIIGLGWFAVDELPEGLPRSQKEIVRNVVGM